MRILDKFIILCLFLPAACSETPTYINGEQYLPVDAGASKRIILLPAREVNCEENDSECYATKQQLDNILEKFEICTAKGLGRTAPNVTLMKTADNDNIDPASMDYHVKITVENNSSEKEFAMDGAGDSSGFMLLIGQQWIKTAKVYSRIYDADTQQLAGELTADLTESASWFVPTFLVVPLPIPIVNNPNVENTSCTEMGEALGRFFMGAGNDYIR